MAGRQPLQHRTATRARARSGRLSRYQSRSPGRDTDTLAPGRHWPRAALAGTDSFAGTGMARAGPHGRLSRPGVIEFACQWPARAGRGPRPSKPRARGVRLRVGRSGPARPAESDSVESAAGSVRAAGGRLPLAWGRGRGRCALYRTRTEIRLRLRPEVPICQAAAARSTRPRARAARPVAPLCIRVGTENSETNCQCIRPIYIGPGYILGRYISA